MREARVPELWAGTDAGKAAHHCTVIDADGTKVLSRRVPNNETELLELIRDVLALAGESPVTSPPSGGGPVAPQPWPWSSSSSSPPDSGGGRAVNAPHLVPLLSSTFRATLRAISPSPTTCPGGAVCWSVRVIVGQYGGVSLAISG
ncbi:IS110 family transposase [Streptomyces tubercidicus]|uniref:IS110 family transposase n=1 Tax=Streptomyces tubercidicus TaxID=47759 RepID=UPI00399ACB50